MDRPVEATDRDRERVARRLRDHFVAGTLGQRELEARLAQALSAGTVRELRGLIADLPRDPAAPSRRVPRRHLKPLSRIDVTDDSVSVRFLGIAWFHIGTRWTHVSLSQITRVTTVRQAHLVVSGMPVSGWFSKGLFAGVINAPTGPLLAAARPHLPALVIDAAGVRYNRLVLHADDVRNVAARIRAWLDH